MYSVYLRGGIFGKGKEGLFLGGRRSLSCRGIELWAGVGICLWIVSL